MRRLVRKRSGIFEVESDDQEKASGVMPCRVDRLDSQAPLCLLALRATPTRCPIGFTARFACALPGAVDHFAESSMVCRLAGLPFSSPEDAWEMDSMSPEDVLLGHVCICPKKKEIPTNGYRRIIKNNPLVIFDFRMTNYDLGNSRAGARGGRA